MAAAVNILIVDDEEMIRDAVGSFLKRQGYGIFTAETGREALQVFQERHISLVILDLMLPDISGEEVCARIRRQSRIPVIMLTAKSMEEDIINGLHIGADDYIVKPFSLRQLDARITAVLRRGVEDLKPLAERFSWNQGDLCIDFEKGEIRKKGMPVAVTPIERKLLAAFVRHPRQVFTRDDLLSIAFDIGFDGYDRVIDTHIKNLRKKIEDNPKSPVYIQTVYGIGYRFGGEKEECGS